MRPDRDVLQFDPALTYGLVEYLRTLEMLERARLVARAAASRTAATSFAVHIAPGLGTGRQRVLSGRLPAVRRLRGRRSASRTATSALPETPGIGFEAKADLYAVLRAVAE